MNDVEIKGVIMALSLLSALFLLTILCLLFGCFRGNGELMEPSIIGVLIFVVSGIGTFGFGVFYSWLFGV